MAVRKASKQGKLSRFLNAPLRFLVRAKDYYSKSITGYSDQVIIYGTVPYHAPTQPVNMMPRSYSAHTPKSTQFDDDYKELLRAASTKSLRNKAVSDRALKVWSQKSPTNNAPRSQSVVIGRIDEDAPFTDFGGRDHELPRSRTYAAPNKTTSLKAF